MGFLMHSSSTKPESRQTWITSWYRIQWFGKDMVKLLFHSFAGMDFGKGPFPRSWKETVPSPAAQNRLTTRCIFSFINTGTCSFSRRFCSGGQQNTCAGTSPHEESHVIIAQTIARSHLLEKQGSRNYTQIRKNILSTLLESSIIVYFGARAQGFFIPERLHHIPRRLVW
jgi:hypothetical protein